MAAISEKNTSPTNEQLSESDKAVFHDETLHSAAERGHAATDKFGNSLLTFDKQAEARLRLKIDLYIIPTVAVLYLFCFIDRANIGRSARLRGRLVLIIIGNARLAGFEKDLALQGYDYNTVLSVFYISKLSPIKPSFLVCSEASLRPPPPAFAISSPVLTLL